MDAIDPPWPLEEEWVEPDWVRLHLQDPELRLVDCGPAFQYHDGGHLPGACPLDWENELSFVEGEEENESLYFTYLCLQKKILPDSLCVFYAEGNQEFAWKTLRIFRRFGHQRVKILRGGREAWIRCGFPLNRSRILPQIKKYPVPAEVVSVRCYSHEF